MKITRRQLRKIIKETWENERWNRSGANWEGPREDPLRPWGSYAEKGGKTFYDVITMSPNGDSVLVDGMETYITDVPTQIEHVSGIKMDDATGDALVAELENQMMSGYVEKAIEYKNGQWSL